MRYVVKELALYDLNQHSSQHWIFKPPEGLEVTARKAVRANDWVSRHLHRIPWEEGDVEYKELTRILDQIASQYDVIYVKGQQKIEFLLEEVSLQPAIVNVENLGCPKICVLLEPLRLGCHCIFHNFDPTLCTAYRAKAIGRWILCNN